MVKHIKEIIGLTDYWTEAVKNPETAPVPEVMATQARLVMLAARNVEPETFRAFFTYVQRMDLQWQVLFALVLCENANTQKMQMAVASKDFCKFLKDNAKHF